MGRHRPAGEGPAGEGRQPAGEGRHRPAGEGRHRPAAEGGIRHPAAPQAGAGSPVASSSQPF